MTGLDAGLDCLLGERGARGLHGAGEALNLGRDGMVFHVLLRYGKADCASGSVGMRTAMGTEML
jgi:methyl coenzyme M reductase gamma subunit